MDLKIEDFELLALEADRAALALAKRELSRLEKIVEARNAELLEKIHLGAQCVGKLKAAITKKKGQCRPPWQAEWTLLQESLGLGQVEIELEVQRIRGKYPPKETETIAVISSE